MDAAELRPANFGRKGDFVNGRERSLIWCIITHTVVRSYSHLPTVLVITPVCSPGVFSAPGTLQLATDMLHRHSLHYLIEPAVMTHMNSNERAKQMHQRRTTSLYYLLYLSLLPYDLECC